jgi:iron complex outermembrane receptor protein
LTRTYYDQLLQRGDLFEDIRHTADIQLQHQRGVSERTELIWGLGYRRSDFRLGGNQRIRVLHSKGTDAIYSGFGQIEHRPSNTLRATLGSKLEWNDVSGWEVQPSIRGIWFPSRSQQVWAAISRAVRTPSQGELNADIISVVLPPGTLGLGSSAFPVQTIGNPKQKSEVLVAYELGYRAQIDDRVSIDLSAFWNDYERLRRAVPIAPINLSQVVDNGSAGRGLGVEALVDVKALSWWRTTFSYSLFDFRERSPLAIANTEGLTPRHQWRVSSYMTLTKSAELDLTFYWVDDAEDLARAKIDRYTRLDARLGWRPAERLTLELIGQNLLDRQHLEANSLFSPEVNTEIERSVFARATWTL